MSVIRGPGEPHQRVHRTPVVRQQPIILLVEDNDILRGIFRDALLLSGFRVHDIADGYDALRFLEEQTPALVVLDLRLQTLDGRDVLEEMRARQMRVPVVVMTGSEDELSGFEVMCILRKPVTPKTLIATVMQCFST